MGKNEFNKFKIAGAFCVMSAFALLIVPPQRTIPASNYIELEPVISALSVQEITPESEKLIPLGKTTGIKVYCQGAMIVGFAELEGAKNQSPAKNAGLKTGDIIIAINDGAIQSNEDLVEALKALNEENVAITVKRGDANASFDVKAVFDSKTKNYKIGAWVRDSMAGIGTITYVDPKNGAFGALGHGICDVDTGQLMPVDDGSLMNSRVTGVKKGASGTPGELSGAFDLTRDQGKLSKNTNSGVYGKITDKKLYSGQKAISTAAKSEIKTGKANIIANISGQGNELFEIEIVKVFEANDGTMRDMMIKVTDKNLINSTGGIVQGMSGSPIIQNGKLVGAVTHVLINDPQKGYAISIERMLAGCKAA